MKVCCIRSLDEAWMAVHSGASAVGLVSAMPSGPGPIPLDRIAAIAALVPPGISRFLLTSERTAGAILEQLDAAGVDTVQMCDVPEEGCHATLSAARPAVRLVQVIHVTDPGVVADAARVAPQVDAVLLDSGNPALPVKELGGTGRTHDWGVSLAIRECIPKPVWLAGGLTPENVAEAIERVRPFGVDVCSGVRTDGRLDGKKLARFMEAVGG